MIRVFVGTDPQQAVAERALAASILRNTPGDVSITWMRQGDNGWDWGGRAAGWATPFSMFRWYVPQTCNYEGRAIYLDADMLVLADLRELWEWELPTDAPGAYCGRDSRKADVILWQCGNAGRWDREQYEGRHALVRDLGGDALRWHKLPPEWDHCDKMGPNTKILHFTKLSMQPHKPYPDMYPYDQPHTDPAACELFWKYAVAGEAPTD